MPIGIGVGDGGTFVAVGGADVVVGTGVLVGASVGVGPGVSDGLATSVARATAWAVVVALTVGDEPIAKLNPKQARQPTAITPPMMRNSVRFFIVVSFVTLVRVPNEKSAAFLQSNLLAEFATLSLCEEM